MTQIFAQLITAIGILAFLVTVIIEVIKGVSCFKKIPTNLIVLILSIILTVTGGVVYIQIQGIPFLWFYAIALLILGFIVSFLAMFGWDKLSELFNRFKKGE